MYERLYDVSETSPVSFVGFMTDQTRYDLAIIYTDSFFGKPLVVCMQTGKSALLCADDINNHEYLEHVFRLNDRSAAEEMAYFLGQRLPAMGFNEQY